MSASPGSVGPRRALEFGRRGWWGVPLPGYREDDEYATYAFSSSVPPVRRDLDLALEWLRAAPRVPGSLAEDVEEATHRADADSLAALLSDARITLPTSFVCFIEDAELRTRIRSCTACYLDLADRVVPAPGGSLVHFLSDQQWVLHWLLYVGDDGSEAVIATDTPYGFDEEAPASIDESAFTSASDGNAVVCAESFVEFLYRFWIENEIWFALEDGSGDLTPEQRLYLEAHHSNG